MTWLLSLAGTMFTGLGWGVLGLSVLAALAVWLFGKVLPDWIAPVLIVLLGAAFVVTNASKDAQIAGLKLDWQTEKTTLAEGKATAEKQARAAETALSNKERDLNTTIATNALEKADEQKQHQARLAAATAANHGLQRQLAALKSAYQRDAANPASAPASHQPPAGQAIKLLADLLGSCEARAVERAGFADAAHAAAVACARDYDAARAAMMELSQPP